MTDLPTTNPQPGIKPKAEAPSPTRYTVDGKPRIGWPEAMLYRWVDEGGVLRETALPPPLYPVPKRMPSGLDAQRVPYQVITINIDLYDALRRDCAHLMDSAEHWGVERVGIVVDNRR